MDQTRPLKLPETLSSDMRNTIGSWGVDGQAPRWINRIEDWFTGVGDWRMGAK